MFLTNPCIALRGISVPMDLAFPGEPAVSPGEEGGYGSSVCCRSPGSCRGRSRAVLNPPCPARAPGSPAGMALPPALGLRPFRPAPGAACPCPAAAPPGLAGPGWAEPALLLPARSRSCSPGCSQMGKQSLGLMQHSVLSGFIH